MVAEGEAGKNVAQMPGAEAAGMSEVLATPGLIDRRAAVAELGAELRALIDAVVRTEASSDVLRRAADAVRQVAGPLSEVSRPISRPPAVDDLLSGLRLLNPVIGEGNPIAPPLLVTMVEGGAVGACTLGPAYEGPPMCGHGGVSALLLDQVLGHAAASVGNPGVTTGLSLRYRKPVPLDVPIRVWAEVTGVDGRRTAVKGGITTLDELDVQLVEAEGHFERLRPDQAKRLFSRLSARQAVPPDAAHD
jgi:acyl-coenzyme A thioesterase PaaI-like protein